MKIPKYIEEEMKSFAEGYNLDENKAFEMTCSIWEKHIVTKEIFV